MHPSRLHALAALASLEAAQAVLARYVRGARQAGRSGAEADLGTVQAWRPGLERQAPRSAPANPLLDAVIRHFDGPVDPLLDRARRTADTLAWLAAAVLGDDYRTKADPLVQIRETLPALMPTTCATVAEWAGEQDRLVRQAVGVGDDLQPWPGVTCPACELAGVLALRTSGPAEARVVVCTEACPCEGDACGCGMPRKAAGVPHIWPLAVIRGALA